MFQAALTAGDSLNFYSETPGYSAADGWALRFRLVPRAGAAAVIEVSPSAEGAGHRTQVGASVTATWSAGSYGWAAWVEKGTEKYSVGAGVVEILADPRQIAAGTDTRGLAQKTVDDLKAARSEWARTQGRTRSYKIADRERTYATSAELDAELRYWEGQLAAENAAARLAAGFRPKNRILTRFTRPR